jgi:hypothetical protein
MAEQLSPLPATQAAQVRSLVPARHTIIVEKLTLFCKAASKGTRCNLQALQLQCIRALLAASAAKFNITLVRWQHPSHVAFVYLLRAKGKRKEMTGTQHVGTLKHKFLQYITIKNELVLFHYQNNLGMNSSSAIWWRHLPVTCNNFFEAGVSGNSIGALVS